MNAQSSVRSDVFRSIVRLARRAGVASALSPQLPHLEAWMNEWNLDAEKRSDIFLQLSQAFKEGGQL